MQPARGVELARSRGVQLIVGVAIGLGLLLGLHVLGVGDALTRMTIVIKRLGVPRGGGGAVARDRTPAGGAPTLSQEYVVSLPGGADRQDRFLRTKVVFELASAEDRALLEANASAVRDAFIRHSVDVPADAYGGRAGIDRSRALLRKAVSSTHPGIAVKGIYFSDFVLR